MGPDAHAPISTFQRIGSQVHSNVYNSPKSPPNTRPQQHPHTRTLFHVPNAQFTQRRNVSPNGGAWGAFSLVLHGDFIFSLFYFNGAQRFEVSNLERMFELQQQ